MQPTAVLRMARGKGKTIPIKVCLCIMLCASAWWGCLLLSFVFHHLLSHPYLILIISYWALQVHDFSTQHGEMLRGHLKSWRRLNLIQLLEDMFSSLNTKSNKQYTLYGMGRMVDEVGSGKSNVSIRIGWWVGWTYKHNMGVSPLLMHKGRRAEITHLNEAKTKWTPFKGGNLWSTDIRALQ